MGARVKAYAKLNLTLAITGVNNGWHMLDSLVCSVDIFDLIKINKRRDGKINVQMRGMGIEALPPEQNNAYKAAKAYISRFNCGGADITIYKNIPVGAGMGGSSADAAGVIRGMSKLYGFGSERELKEIADSLGSDTGYMLTGGFARLSGRGERVFPLKVKSRLNFVLLLPDSGVSTPQCYKEYDKALRQHNSSESAVNALINGDLAGLGKGLNNALYAPATALNGDIKMAFEELEGFSPLGVNMTGSGSCVYALFENEEFCRWAKSRYRGRFGCLITKSVIPKI